MARVIVGRWGKSLAIRVPFELARDSGLSVGEQVEIEAQDGDIVIRRSAARARGDAERAAAEIIAEAKRHSLGAVPLRELLDEGRRQMSVVVDA